LACGSETISAAQRYAVPYDLIQGQGHRGSKVAKMVDFKIYLLRQYACSHKSDSELQYSWTISECFPDRYLIFFLVRRHVTIKVRLLRGV